MKNETFTISISQKLSEYIENSPGPRILIDMDDDAKTRSKKLSAIRGNKKAIKWLNDRGLTPYKVITEKEYRSGEFDYEIEN